MFLIKRLDLSEGEFEILKHYIDFEKMEEANKRFNKDENYYQTMGITESLESKLLKKLNNPKKIKYSLKKTVASSKATESRSKAAREKIQNAINILRMENKKITHYSIAETGGVSFATVKKYLDNKTIETLNKTT